MVLKIYYVDQNLSCWSLVGEVMHQICCLFRNVINVCYIHINIYIYIYIVIIWQLLSDLISAVGRCFHGTPSFVGLDAACKLYILPRLFPTRTKSYSMQPFNVTQSLFYLNEHLK